MTTITGISHVDLTVTDLDASEAWYRDLLDATSILDGRNDDHHFSARYLLHAETMTIIGLVGHDESGSSFDERAVGLDHLSFNVASREDLDAWARRLDTLGIAHSPISENEMWDVLPFRDPDNIQLELFYMKPEAAALLG